MKTAAAVPAMLIVSLAVIDGAGHPPFVEFPERFNAVLIDGCRLAD